MGTPHHLDLSTLQSLLFVPTLNRNFVERAHARNAQAIVLDLEDSIVNERKLDARTALADAAAVIRPHGLPLLARINNDAELLEADLSARVGAGVDAILVPNVDNAEFLAYVSDIIAKAEQQFNRPQGHTAYIALIESPTGVVNLASIVKTGGRLRGLGFGSEDYAAVIGTTPTEDALTLPAQLIAIAARSAGLAAWGIPGSIGDFKDVNGFYALVRRARVLGFTGTLGIHPLQIEQINRAFAPTSDELHEAQRIVDAYDAAQRAGLGAVALDGKMIDAPIVERARRLLAKHDKT